MPLSVSSFSGSVSEAIAVVAVSIVLPSLCGALGVSFGASDGATVEGGAGVSVTGGFSQQVLVRRNTPATERRMAAIWESLTKRCYRIHPLGSRDLSSP